MVVAAVPAPSPVGTAGFGWDWQAVHARTTTAKTGIERMVPSNPSYGAGPLCFERLPVGETRFVVSMITCDPYSLRQLCECRTMRMSRHRHVAGDPRPALGR